MTDRVLPFIRELCCMDRFGGRCTRLDYETWEINDIAQWTETHTAGLRRRFPSIEARVVSNHKSLSGFSIMLHQQRASHAWVSLLVTAALTASIAAAVYTL